MIWSGSGYWMIWSGSSYSSMRELCCSCYWASGSLRLSLSSACSFLFSGIKLSKEDVAEILSILLQSLSWPDPNLTRLICYWMKASPPSCPLKSQSPSLPVSTTEMSMAVSNTSTDFSSYCCLVRFLLILCLLRSRESSILFPNLGSRLFTCRGLESQMFGSGTILVVSCNRGEIAFLAKSLIESGFLEAFLGFWGDSDNFYIL